MASRSVPERYILLGLRIGKHIDELVDAYVGPADLQALVDGEEPAPAGALLDEARALLAEADGWSDDEQRLRWLRAQLRGLECVAEMLGGTEVPWREAVRRCYGVDVEVTPEERFAEAHEALDEVLPGQGDLAERLERWEKSQEIDRAKILPGFDAFKDALRERTRELIDLPDNERIDAETVENEPWAAYNWYLGDFRSRIQINIDLPMRSYVLPILASHEGYPGHHTEGVCKEAKLIRELDRVEATILLLHTPECVVSEGIAQIALEQAFGERWPARAAEILRTLDIELDVEVTQAVVGAQKTLDDVHVNVACLANEQGWSVEEAVAYHRRWGLTPEERARKSTGFDLHPTFSIYVPTYSYGYRFARAYAASRPDGFRSLLTEQLTTDDLLDALPVG